MIMTNERVEGRVCEELVEDLRQSGLVGTFVEVGGPRFIKFLLQPKLIMRSGWLFDPVTELGQSDFRAYVLRASHDFDKTGVLQQLRIDRNARKATLVTQGNQRCQTIEVDLQTFEVLSNSVAARLPDTKGA